MGETKTNQEKALGRIKTAFWGAVILVIITGGLRILVITGGNQTLKSIVTYIADPIIILALAIWLYKRKSCTASILLLIVFLLGKASLFIPLLEADLSSEQQNALAKVAARQLIWIGIFGYAFIQGILGAFSYRRLMKANADGALTSVTVEKIINDYGAFLDSPDAGPPGCIVDAQKLPWPKEKIKQAIFTALDSTSDAKARDVLIGGLLYLPFYQVGVGKNPVGLDHSKFSHITDANELARVILPHLEVTKKWEPIIKAEQAEIDAVLKSRGIVL